MFGSKKSKQSSPIGNGAATAGSQAAPAAPAKSEVPVDLGSPDKLEARRPAAIAVRHSLAFSQIVSLLMRSPRHKHLSLADLEWLVLPPLLAGNFRIAEAKSKPNGVPVAFAVVLWASVSPEVDRRLSEDLDKPIRLQPKEWRSGDIVWLIDAVGDPRLLPQFLKRLNETTFKGREVKVRRRGQDGKPTLGVLGLAA